MKKTITIFLTLSMVFAATACNAKTDQDPSNITKVTQTSETTNVFGFEDEPADNGTEYAVADEDKAQKVIKSPHDNLFGIEKMVLFENRMVAVFDKDTNDKTTAFFLDGTDGISYLWFSFNNLSPMETSYKVTEDGDKYILEASCEYKKADLIDPDREVKIVDFFARGTEISMYIAIYGDDLELNLYKAESDSYSQYFDSAENKWDKVVTDKYEPADNSDTGITISYSLSLANPWGDDLIDENSGIKYHLIDFGHYLTVEIENASEETKTLGGTRYLQRIKGDMLIDLGRDGGETTTPEGKVKDHTKVMIWDITGVGPETPYNLSEKPKIVLDEKETITIEPGQRYYVKILIEDFDADKSGMYRMTFGDLTMDIETSWETIW